MAQDDAGYLWHREVIADEVEATLHALRDRRALDSFYLAGGTALALALGHRRSVDLDFFTSGPFDTDALLCLIEAIPDFSLSARDHETIHATIGRTKVSFLGYRYPLLFPALRFIDVAVAEPRDIACMKINAIASRGTKRDFIDLYAVAQSDGLRMLFRRFAAKYAQTHYNPLHIVKSLTFFDDAEKDPMPDMLVPCAWAEVKQFFAWEAPRLLQGASAD